MIQIRIPGEPVAQGRPRFSTRGGFVKAIDPSKSRNWKATAQEHMRLAMEAVGMYQPLPGPLRCTIVAVFTCPKSDYRSRTRVLVRPHAKRPDAENVAKAVLDAASGAIFLDDSQVADLRVRKLIAEPGAAPYVLVIVAGMSAKGDLEEIDAAAVAAR